MQINIENRIVIITGPSTIGKSTLSRMIKENSSVQTAIISYDAIASKIDQSQTEAARHDEFSAMLIEKIGETVGNPENKLIIFEMPGIEESYISGLLQIVEIVNHFCDDVTLIKIQLPINKHLEYMKLRMQIDPTAKLVFDSFDDYCQNIMAQREYYEMFGGSLHYDFPVRQEYIIDDPSKITLNFDFTKKLKK